jgi:hypothetical protein
MKVGQTILSRKGYPLAMNRGRSPSLDSAVYKEFSSDSRCASRECVESLSI